MAYAEATAVAFEKSIAEIITLIKRHRATQIGQFEGEAEFAIQFVLADRLIRFRLPIPSLGEMPVRNGRHEVLTPAQRHDKLAQARRSRGRALLLVIKAKLESVESGIETVEQAFLANVVMPGDTTVYERIKEQIALQYDCGNPSAILFLPAS